MAAVWYAVARGRKTGVFSQWFGSDGAEAQVRGVQGAAYKKFSCAQQAREWLATWSAAAAEPAAPRAASRRPTTAPTTPPPATEIVLYTDGGCRHNPGPGGYGVVLFSAGTTQECSGGYSLTTNNRMELTACIRGLEQIAAPGAVTLYSDSQYVVNGINKGWARRWRRNNWMRNSNEKAENSDLWQRLLELCEFHAVEFVWVRGHNGNVYNERCDALAAAMSGRGQLPPDPGYSGAVFRQTG